MVVADFRILENWLRRYPLVVSFGLSLMIHSAMFGAWQVGKVFGWWEHQATWLLTWKANKKPLLDWVQKQIHAQEERKVIPMTFVEVDPTLATAEPPKETKYYGALNSVAANPDPAPVEPDKPKIEGSQDKIIRLVDNPRQEPFPLQPTPPPEEVEPPAKLAKNDPPDQSVSREMLNIGAPPSPKRERPRTLAAARAQDSSLVGRTMKQQGGVSRRGRVSLNVKATPFGAYDWAFIRAVEQRWFDLLDNTPFVQQSGKVVLEFQLNSDGRITDMREEENDVGEILGLLCQRAILDPAPYAPWPTDMRRAIGANYREVTFTFYYY
jgi:hypothetical protein